MYIIYIRERHCLYVVRTLKKAIKIFEEKVDVLTRP